MSFSKTTSKLSALPKSLFNGRLEFLKALGLKVQQAGAGKWAVALNFLAFLITFFAMKKVITQPVLGESQFLTKHIKSYQSPLRVTLMGFKNIKT